LREEEQRLKVDLQDVIPVFFAELKKGGAADDAGIVDQDIEPPKRCNDFCHHFGKPSGTGFPQITDHRVITPSQRLNLLTGIGAFSHVQPGDVGARFSQAQRHGLSQPAAGSGHQGNFAIQFERV
jgi:hypothetical protein